jgi:hypothetical protein
MDGKRSKKIGLPPGTPFKWKSSSRKQDFRHPTRNVMPREGNYECLRSGAIKDSRTTTWINVDGIHDDYC